MKTLPIVAALLILSACSGEEKNKVIPPKEKGYFLIVESKEHSALKRYDDKKSRYEIRAKSDSEAYAKGIATFAGWQQAYDTVKTNYLWKSESFSVQDEEKKDVLEQLDKSTRQIIQNKYSPASLSNKSIDSSKTNQNSIALNHWKFGMNKKLYKQKETGLQTVGKQMYYFKPFFDDSVGLYKIILEGPETNVKSFDTKIKKAYENLYQVFSTQYGSGKQLNAYPLIKSMNKGYIKWLHEWKAGTKHIKVGIASLLNGEEFFSVCWITDIELAAVNQAAMRNK